MMNIITGIVNGTHYVSQAAGIKVIEDKKSFEENYNERVNQVARVNKVKEISNLSNQNQPIKTQEFFRTEIVTNDKGERSIVLLASNQRFRQINLEGTRTQGGENLINSARAKAAYLNSESLLDIVQTL